ncbi:hypothetical protein [Alloyangia pacifica]|uniref:hypothetical protein n=1 Tax=Alloyangia pacifica TaxID=311180 RepID=UPI001CFF3D7F|nr:hypothetical protein [Alloyangia pacifica]
MAETTADVTERIQILLDLQKDAHDKAARASAREIAKLEKSYDPLARATIRYKQETDKLATALRKGTITEQRHAQLLEKVQAEYDQTAARLNKLTAAQDAHAMTGNTVFASVNRNKQAFQQLGYQVGDFAVQVGSGTSALTAFAQQGSQVLGFLGPWGALAGAALAITLPLAGAFLDTGEEAKSFADALEDAQSAIDAYVSAADLAMMSTEQLEDRFGSAASRIRATLDLLEQIARSEAQRKIDGINASISELLNMETDGDRRLDVAEFFGFSDLEFFFGEARKGIRSMAGEFQFYQDQLAASSGDLDAQIAAMSQLIDVTRQLAAERGGVTAEEEALIKQLAETLVLMEDQRGKVEQVESSTYALSDAVFSVVDAIKHIDFGAAIDQAQSFADVLREAAGNAWSMAQARAYHGANMSGGRGADPRQFGGSARDWQKNNPYPVFEETAKLPSTRTRASQTGASGTNRVEREAEQAAAAYDRLMRSLDPLRAVAGEYADNQNVLNEALAAGKITSAEFAAGMELVDQAHEKALADLSKNDALKNLRDDVEGLTESLLRTAAAGGSVGDALRNFLLDATLQAAAQNLTSALFGAAGSTGGGLFGTIASSILGQRAGGGGVRGGSPYLVNEGTPNSEVFVPSRSGGILNVPQAQAALSKATGGSASATTVSVPISIDARGAQAGVAEQIAQQMERMRPQMQADAVTAVYKANKERPLR